MKRTRSDLINQIVYNGAAINNLYNYYSYYTNEINETVIEVTNYDLQQHKEDTLKQFQKWKAAFIEDCESPTIVDLINNSKITWNVKCYTDGTNTDMKFYSNMLTVQFNDELCFNASIYVTDQHSPIMEKMTLSYENNVIDLLTENSVNLNLVNLVNVNVNELINMLGLYYFTFIFNPETPSDVYSLETNVSSIAIRISELFGKNRCKQFINLSERDLEPDFQKRMKTLEPPILEFNPLYNEDIKEVDEDQMTINPMPHILYRWYS